MTNLSRWLIAALFLLSGCTNHFAPSLPVSQTTSDAWLRQGHFAEALAQLQAEDSHDASNLLHQARAYKALGHAREALRCAEQGLKQADSASQQAEALLTLADIELSQGLRSQVIEHLQQARPMIAPASRLAVSLALVETQQAIGEQDLERAIKRLESALTTAQQLGDTSLQREIEVSRWAIMTESRASHQPLFSTEEWTALRQTVTDVLALEASYTRDFIAIKLAKTLLDTQADASLIESLLDRATASSRERGDQRLTSYALGYRGTLAERQQQWPQALEATAQAAFAAQQADALDSLYLWEWQTARILQVQHRFDDALAAYRRALFNLQRIRTDLGTGTVFREKVAPLYVAFSDALLKKARETDDKHQVEALLREVRDVLEQQKAAELQDYFQDRCVANFKAKRKAVEAIGEHTAVIYPVMLEDRTEILLGLADGMRQVVIPVTKETLQREIHDFRNKLEKRTTFQYLRPAQQLYQWLMAPLLSELRAQHIDTLVIVPDGALRSIPLAALHDGQRYLIEEFAIATTPGLALTDPQPLPPENLAVLLNGLTQSVQDFPPLPNVASELHSIQDEYGGVVLQDAEFRLQTMGDALQKTPYRIVHIASHGQFDQNPEKTFLLTYDDKLTMDMLERYISIGKFRDEAVELLTLSACQTAAGDDRAALGLAGVAVKAGARSALASLWFINDQASSELVSHFYRELQRRVSKAHALQRAQLSLQSDPRYRHAGYWAAFLIIGNWL